MLDKILRFCYNVLINQPIQNMQEIIICENIELDNAEMLPESVTVSAFLKEGDSILNDWRAIKSALEYKLGRGVYTFSYKYAK